MQPKNKIITTYSRILTYVRQYWFWFALGILGTMLSSAVDATLTWSLKPLLDLGFIAHDKLFIALLPAFVLVAFLVRGVTNFMGTYFINRVSRSVIMVLRQQTFSHILRLPARYFDNTSSGQLLSLLIYNIDQVASASADALVIIVRESCFIMGLLTVMFITSWRLTLLFFLTAPLIALIARTSSKKIRNYSRRVQSGMGAITQIAEEAIEGYKVIRTFGGETYEYDKFVKATHENRRQEMQLIATNAIASPAVQLVIAVIIALTIYLATTAVGNISPGGFASVLAALLAILKPLRNITTVNNTIQKGVVGAESIFQLLDEKPEEDTGQLKIERVKGEIRLSNISFAYTSSNNKQVLKNINFHVKSGQTIALVGKSGAGKSTLVSLLPRFYDNYQGLLTIDDIDIKQIKLEELRNQFAFVSQHVTLFNDTIAHNIAYGRFSQVSREEIIAAAQAANALDFIQQMPDGLDTLIGENGVLLSGGQRQRIAIARALLKNAPILILDEATSALDSESELHIYSALEKLMRSRTTLVIAHRLSTVENADRIIVLQNGEIVESGTHHELLALGNEYARLYAMQFKDTSMTTNNILETSELLLS